MAQKLCNAVEWKVCIELEFFKQIKVENSDNAKMVPYNLGAKIQMVSTMNLKRLC